MLQDGSGKNIRNAAGNKKFKGEFKFDAECNEVLKDNLKIIP